MRAKVISNGDDKHLEIRKDGIIGLAVSGMSAILLPTGVCMYSLPRPETRTGHAVPPCSSTIHPFVRDHGTPPRGAEEPDKAWAQCQSRRLVRGRLGRGIRRHARHTPRRTFGDLRSRPSEVGGRVEVEGRWDESRPGGGRAGRHESRLEVLCRVERRSSRGELTSRRAPSGQSGVR